jgi:DNA repair protein RadC
MSAHCADFLYDWWDKGTIELFETFAVLLLNRGNHVLGVYKASQGGHTGTVADAKNIFGAALLGKACSIVLAHNHPSGAMYPSSADIRLTHKLVAGGKLLDITVLDHIILTPTRGRYYSFADNEGLTP